VTGPRGCFAAVGQALGAAAERAKKFILVGGVCQCIRAGVLLDFADCLRSSADRDECIPALQARKRVHFDVDEAQLSWAGVLEGTGRTRWLRTVVAVCRRRCHRPKYEDAVREAGLSRAAVVEDRWQRWPAIPGEEPALW